MDVQRMVGSGRGKGLGKWLEMGEIPKLILKDLIVMGAGEAGGLGRRGRKK